jgi:hypothetical protein
MGLGAMMYILSFIKIGWGIFCRDMKEDTHIRTCPYHNDAFLYK